VTIVATSAPNNLKEVENKEKIPEYQNPKYFPAPMNTEKHVF
jgi:hypothetical protein